MESTNNNYVEVDYELFVPNESGNIDLVEKTSEEHPFAFITGLGFALESFEEGIKGLKEGDEFDFTIPVDKAYGEFTEEHVIELAKDIFKVDGKFDEARIYPGNVIPLANADGNRFDGIVKEVRDNFVVMDLNHPLACKPLHFKGHIVANRPATTKEIESFVNKMNGEEDCECCGHHHEGCNHHHEGNGGCCHHHDGGCCKD